MDAALGRRQPGAKSEPAGPKDPPADSAQKLIEKLAASGQLKAGFLMRVLSQGQMDLFDLAFCAPGLDAGRWPASATSSTSSGVRAVALACRAAGIDRSVFATVFNLSRQARGMPRHLDQPRISRRWTRSSPALPARRAMDELRSAAGS